MKLLDKTSSTSCARRRQGLICRILVPVDFSDCSLAGLKFAVRFAKEVGAGITVLHVADLGPVMMTTACGNYDSPTYTKAARRRSGKQMRAFLRRVDFDDVPVHTSAVAGYCPTAIHEAAAKERGRLDYDLDAWPDWFCAARFLVVLLKAPCDLPSVRW